MSQCMHSVPCRTLMLFMGVVLSVAVEGAGRKIRDDRREAPSHHRALASRNKWSAHNSHRRGGVHHPSQTTCTEKWFEQKLDHFSWANDTTWSQRYFICADDWRRPSATVRRESPWLSCALVCACACSCALACVCACSCMHGGWWRGRGFVSGVAPYYYIFIIAPPQVDAGPIFFYCGNEADVEGYVEHTGLMYGKTCAGASE